MALIRTLARPILRYVPENRHDVVIEFLTYCTVGVVNTLFGQLMFNVFLGLGALTANAISTALATICSFILNRNITYRDRARTPLRRELPLFVFLNVINLGIQQGILDAGRRTFSIPADDRLELNILRVVAVVVGMIFLMLTYRTFVFKKKQPEPTATAQVEPSGAEYAPAAAYAPEAAHLNGSYASQTAIDGFAALAGRIEAGLDSGLDSDLDAGLDADLDLDALNAGLGPDVARPVASPVGNLAW